MIPFFNNTKNPPITIASTISKLAPDKKANANTAVTITNNPSNISLVEFFKANFLLQDGQMKSGVLEALLGSMKFGKAFS